MLTVTLDKPGTFSAGDAPETRRAAHDALVRVHRIGVCGTDLHAFAGRQPFFNYPRVLGHELGVEVLELPESETRLKVGDRCAVEPYLNCGECIACRRGKPNCCASLRVLGVHVDGGMRPLLSVPVEKLHPSSSLGFDQLALVETLAIGAHAVERGDPADDETALVIGLGPIGLGVVAALTARGVRVIAMDISRDRLAFCGSTMGVTKLVAVSGDDVHDQLREAGHGDLPTLVVDATGNARSMASSFGLVAAGGRLVFAGLFKGDVTFNDPEFHRRELTLLATRNAPPSTFTDLIRRIEAGQINTGPWITRRLRLDDVPVSFSELTEDPKLVKAMIEVDAD